MQGANHSAAYEPVSHWLANDAGFKVSPIAYKGAAAMLTDLVGGQVDVAVGEFSSATELMKAGRLRVLGITLGKCKSEYPQIPTLIDSGFADFEVHIWAGLFARADTPNPVAEKLTATVRRIVASREAATFSAQHAFDLLPLGPREMSEMLLRSYRRLKKAADLAGLHPR